MILSPRFKSICGKGLVLACALAFQWQHLQADQTVSSNDDAGIAGDLRYAITNLGGPGTINWSTGWGGTIALGGDLPTISGGSTVDVSSAGSNVSIVNGYGMPISGNVTFENNSPLNINWTISSIIEGSGTLTKTGAGNLWLEGANTYTGGTVVTGGTLYVNADASLGGAAGPLTLDGGTLTPTAAMTFASTRNMLLGPSSGTINTAFNVVWTGSISDSGGLGSLTKLGTGMLTLSNGTNSYSGGTTVSSGTLQATANNAFGSGALAVSAGAFVDMTNTQQHVASFTSAGTTKMLLQSGVTNLTVNGNATLGGILQVGITPLDGIEIAKGKNTFTPIAYGSSSGTTFSGINSPAAVTFDPVYLSTGVVLTARPIPFADLAVSKNQRTVGNGLDPLRADPTGDMITVMGNLYSLNVTQFDSALDQLGPLSVTTMRGLGLLQSNTQSEAVDRRLGLLSGGADAGSAADRIFGPDSPWGVFVTGLAGRAVLRQTSEAPKTSYNSDGILTGLDYRGDNFAVGVTYGYFDGGSSVVSSTASDAAGAIGRGTVDEKSNRYGIYAAGYGRRFHVNIYAGESADSFSSNRGIDFGNIATTAVSKAPGSELNAHANAAYGYWTGGWGTLSPTVGLSYDKFREESFTESGAADSLNLSVGRQTAESLRSETGILFAGVANLGSYKMGTNMSAGWRHEFKAPNTVEAQLASVGGNSLSVTPLDFGRDGLLTGIGLSVIWTQWSVHLDYTGDYCDRVTQQSINGGVHVKF